MPVPFVVETRDDPEGKKLRIGLVAHVAYERIHSVRIALAHVLVLLGAAVWLVAAEPALLPAPWARALLSGWALGIFALVLIAVREYGLWRRRGRWLLGEEKPTRKAIRECIAHLTGKPARLPEPRPSRK